MSKESRFVRKPITTQSVSGFRRKTYSSLSEGLISFLIRFWWICSVQSLSCVQLFWWIVAIFPFNNTYWAFTISILAQMAKNMPALWETQVQSLGQKDPLEEGMATHSSILAWRIPWTEQPGELQSMGLQRVDTTEWLTHTCYFHATF